VNAALDRVAGALIGLARGADPASFYRGRYRAKVVKVHGNRKRVDVQPEDRDLLPPMSNIPLKVGIPGADPLLVPGHIVLVGWENGRPDRPEASSWDAGSGTTGTIPAELALLADLLELGMRGCTERVYLGTTHAAVMTGFINSLLAAATAFQAAATGPLAGFQPAATSLVVAIQSHKITMEQFDSFLSTRVKVS
jgi:hypothetical protein